MTCRGLFCFDFIDFLAGNKNIAFSAERRDFLPAKNSRMRNKIKIN